MRGLHRFRDAFARRSMRRARSAEARLETLTDAVEFFNKTAKRGARIIPLLAVLFLGLGEFSGEFAALLSVSDWGPRVLDAPFTLRDMVVAGAHLLMRVAPVFGEGATIAAIILVGHWLLRQILPALHFWFPCPPSSI